MKNKFKILNALCDKCNTVQCKGSGNNFSVIQCDSAINYLNGQYKLKSQDNSQIKSNDVYDCNVSIDSDSVNSSIFDKSTLYDSSHLNGSAYEADTCDLSVSDISDYNVSTDISVNFRRNNTVDSGELLGKKQLHSLNCASLNVCGLKRRLHYPDFCELVTNMTYFVFVKQS